MSWEIPQKKEEKPRLLEGKVLLPYLDMLDSQIGRMAHNENSTC